MESTVDKNNNNKGQKSSSTRLAFNSSPFLLWVHPLRLLPKESISFSAFVLSGHPLRQPKRSSVGKKHQKQTTKSKMILTCGGQKDVHAPTPHSALRKTRRPVLDVMWRKMARRRGLTHGSHMTRSSLAFHLFSCLGGSSVSLVRWCENSFFKVCNYPERECDVTVRKKTSVKRQSSV